MYNPHLCISDIFAKLGVNKLLTNILLEKDASKQVAWNTPFAVYAMNRLPFGVKPATIVFFNEKLKNFSLE